MTATADALRQELADALTTPDGSRGTPWRAAVEAVARELFLGTAVYRPNGPVWE